MRTALEGIGWAGLTDAERLAAICGGTLGLGVSMAARALFGGIGTRHQRRHRRNGKAGTGRRR